MRRLIRSGVATACHDVSDGGFAVAVAEMAMASGIGAEIDVPADWPQAPLFFGEDQGRYLVTVGLDPQGDEIADLWRAAEAAGIFAPWIGTTGGDALKLGDDCTIAVSLLKDAHESWFPAYMNS